jgi:hypothetical protein
MAKSYNLLVESWIPVLYNDGQLNRLGIKTILADAHLIRDIAASNPMDRIAVLRFLLAVLYWCKGNPTVDDKQVSQFPADWFAKLDEHRECFNLLGEGRRFYQAKGARRPRPTTDLVHELPTANNPWHFKHLTDGTEGLCASCCALGLLRLPLFTTLGGAGGNVTNYLFAGINGSPPIYTMIQGSTVCETLCRNWSTTERALGSPNWESGKSHKVEAEMTFLAGLTHLPRYVWLGELDEGTCVLCAARAGRIRECNIESPGKNDEESWIDPHTLFRIEKDELKPVRSIDPTKTEFVMNNQWPTFYAASAELNSRDGNDGTRRLVAFTTDKADKIDVTDLSVRAGQTAVQVVNAKETLTEWRKGVRLPQRAETKKRPVTSAFRPHVEHIVSQNPERLLQGGEEGWNDAANEYKQPLIAAARSLAPDYTAEALLRRAEIVRAVPRWNEPKPEGEKPKKKGRTK